MDSFLSFLPTLLSGGLTGLLGTGVSFVTDYFQKKQAHAQELELRRLDIDVAKAEAAGAKAAAEVEAAGQVESSANAALEASYRHAGQRLTRGDSKLMHFADFVRTMLRPTITVALIVLCAVICWSLKHGDAGLKSQLVHMVVYLTETVVLWWFGTRPIRRAAAGTGQ